MSDKMFWLFLMYMNMQLQNTLLPCYANTLDRTNNYFIQNYVCEKEMSFLVETVVSSEPENVCSVLAWENDFC